MRRRNQVRQSVAVSAALLAALFILPLLVVVPFRTALFGRETPMDETEGAPFVSGRMDGEFALKVLDGDTVLEMDLGEYLLGVVRAEMPASFELEALKAQAVAARTFVLYRMANGGTANHPEADACGDITCCQAYKSPEEAAGDWGERAPEYEEKVRRAVTGTDGECILYEGAPVLAVFHSSSAGTTQDAQNVWSTALPYLQSVETPEGEDTVPEYRSTASFSTAQLREKLLRALPDAKLEGSPSNWFTNIRQQPNGTVTGLSVGGVDVGGNRLRTILDLRSACFTISFEGDTVTFSVTGYGHGVGMSQYGANVMAKNGMTYREILEWYYTGTEIGVAGRTVGE